MIKEIVEKYNQENRVNTLNLLRKIKDLDYAIYKDKFKRPCLINKSEQEQIKILIYFDKYQILINEILINTLMSDKEITSIKSGFDSHGILSISRELYNKYFGGAK